MNKIWQIFKKQSFKGKSLIIWKLLMWVPVMISALILAIMVALFQLDIQDGINVFEEITQ
jgi:flagellar biosynthesis protein FliQ